MGRTLKRIAGGLAAATAALTPVAVLAGATPAHAATHWTIDTDHVVLGASSTNSYKAFDGTVESWYDGTGIRGTLTGPFVGRGTLKVTWIFHDGSTASNSDYTGGVQHNINFSSPSGKRVVRFTSSYTPNSGSAETQTNYVGDSPKSAGSCTRLDNDAVNFSPGHGSFNGNVWYGCTSDGHVYAQPSGTTHWSGTTGEKNSTMFRFWYTDGTHDVKFTTDVTASNTTATVGAQSDLTKDVEWVDIDITRSSGVTSSYPTQETSVKFGEL